MAATSKPSSPINGVTVVSGRVSSAAGNQLIDPIVKVGKPGGRGKRKVVDLEVEQQIFYDDANLVSADGLAELAEVQDGSMLLA